MSTIKKFEYQGSTISFEFEDGNNMINATEMIKPFPQKRINNFLRTRQTKDYIEVLQNRYAKKRIEGEKEVLRVVKGGNIELQGTWMDEKLALKFAAWLAPEFELWVYDKIYELLTTGKTELKSRPAKITSIDESYYSVSGYCSLHGIDCPLDKARAWGI